MYGPMVSSRSIDFGLQEFRGHQLIITSQRKVGGVFAVQRTLERVTYNLWAMKKPDYSMKLMATGDNLIADIHAGLQVVNGEREESRNENSLRTHSLLTTTSIIIMLLMITIIFITHCLHRRILR